jgi:hypothetical protein
MPVRTCDSTPSPHPFSPSSSDYSKAIRNAILCNDMRQHTRFSSGYSDYSKTMPNSNSPKGLRHSIILPITPKPCGTLTRVNTWATRRFFCYAHSRAPPNRRRVSTLHRDERKTEGSMRAASIQRIPDSSAACQARKPDLRKDLVAWPCFGSFLKKRNLAYRENCRWPDSPF